VNGSILVLGAAGRMGKLVATSLRQAALGPVAGYDRAAHGTLALEDGPLELWEEAVGALTPESVVVDFSHPDATPLLLRAVQERRARLVVGTTGQSPEQMAALRQAAAETAVVVARNFSLGVNRLLQLAAAFRVFIEDGFDVECVETHHRHKRDAPSGTALALLEALGLGTAPRVDGRTGADALRQPGEVGVHSVRLGAVAGEHALLFGGDHEMIEIRHRALDRAAFVTGVAPAVQFVRRAKPGFYSMLDVMRDAAGSRQ